MVLVHFCLAKILVVGQIATTDIAIAKRMHVRSMANVKRLATTVLEAHVVCSLATQIVTQHVKAQVLIIGESTAIGAYARKEIALLGLGLVARATRAGTFPLKP
mmetsp:Transcript_105203/g.172894  ORF Transcript_105203/g.172894 Transcript_105203/m.172894 type:complete len:104 (-) Transcript_105203:237-548(-)